MIDHAVQDMKINELWKDRALKAEAKLAAIELLRDELKAEAIEWDRWSRTTSLKIWIEPYADMAKLCNAHADRLEAIIQGEVK